MIAWWKTVADRYAALQPRERALIAGAIAVVIGFGGYSLAVEPARIRTATLEAQIAQQSNQIAAIEATLASLQAQVRNPNAEITKNLADVRSQLAAGDRELAKYDNMLVAPNQVPRLLESLVGHHRGLALVSLRSLAPEPLISAPEKQNDKTKAAAAPVPVPGGNIYKHGIEIKLAGSYSDLLAYVAELEQAPQRLLWSKMSLDASAYPRVELTLTVSTLSLDPRWLVL